MKIMHIYENPSKSMKIATFQLESALLSIASRMSISMDIQNIMKSHESHEYLAERPGWEFRAQPKTLKGNG